MTRHLAIFTLLAMGVLLGHPSTAGAQNLDNTSFMEVRSHVRSLWADERFDDAIALLLEQRGNHPWGWEDHTIHFYLGLLYADQGVPARGFEYLDAGLEKGYFYSFSPGYLRQIEGIPGSEQLLRRNERIRQSAVDTAQARVEIRLPEGYEPGKSYPLILFLHGNNSTIAWAREEWRGVHLETPHIVALVQSSNPVSSFAYSWPDDERSRQDVRDAYESVLNQQVVDTGNVILSGFSAGGRVALDAALNRVVPATGFIVFCPPRPASYSEDQVRQLLASNVRGALITGENDFLLAQGLDMANGFVSQGFPLRVVVQSGLGHDYPPDFAHQLNQSIRYIHQPE